MTRCHGEWRKFHSAAQEQLQPLLQDLELRQVLSSSQLVTIKHLYSNPAVRRKSKTCLVTACDLSQLFMLGHDNVLWRLMLACHAASSNKQIVHAKPWVSGHSMYGVGMLKP